jgi:DNA-binding transcriptional LysR family regulator
MIDTKIKTLLTLAHIGNYTKTAEALYLTQPAISHHIRLLEKEYGIKIFYTNKKKLKATPEGEILIEYARKVMALSERARQAVEDSQRAIQRFSIGITVTLAGEYFVSQVFASYFKEHPEIHINIVVNTAKKIYNMLNSYEIDWAIVEGDIPSTDFTSILLDNDYLCLAVSPKHRFAKRKNVSLSELKKEKLILRSPKSGTRQLFEDYLLTHSENIKDFNIIIEIDDNTTIKELVASNLGITIIAHSVCKNEEAAGKLVTIPIDNKKMTRAINIVCNSNFRHTDILEDIRNLYNYVYNSTAGLD